VRLADLPGSLDELRRAVDAGKTFRYRYFWGHKPRADGALSDSVFSQWWKCRFSVDGQAYTSAEQFMMAGKARLFGDAATLAEILATDDPSKVKALGRKVKDFDEKKWAAGRMEIVVRGNVAKFGTGALRTYLIDTGDELLVEASPTDRIWGIGLARDADDAKDPRRWKGQNLLGFALVRARAALTAA
jgi:ribA/ribD-fused uncharacterized protein